MIWTKYIDREFVKSYMTASIFLSLVYLDHREIVPGPFLKIRFTVALGTFVSIESVVLDSLRLLS